MWYRAVLQIKWDGVKIQKKNINTTELKKVKIPIRQHNKIQNRGEERNRGDSVRILGRLVVQIVSKWTALCEWNWAGPTACCSGLIRTELVLLLAAVDWLELNWSYCLLQWTD